jgi:hypothetical protein
MLSKWKKKMMKQRFQSIKLKNKIKIKKEKKSRWANLSEYDKYASKVMRLR